MKKRILSYLLIAVLALGTFSGSANAIVNLNGTTMVDDTNVLKSKTIVQSNQPHGDPLVAAPVCKVSGMNYREYIAYINDYYGYEEGDEGYITGTGNVPDIFKISISGFNYAKNFDIGQHMGAEGARRYISSIAGEYSFYKSLYRMYGSIALHQMNTSNSDGWFTGALYVGANVTSTQTNYTGCNTNAGTDKLPPVPWYEATMAQRGTVYVNAHCELPYLVQRGYTLVSSGIQAYSGKDSKNTADTSDDSTVGGPSYIYSKVFEPGETVEIFNQAMGSNAGHPPAYFFTTAIPDTVVYEYGKKSSGPVATSYNSSLTDGVLYKGIFADVADSADTTGARWVSDYHPLGTGQRIKSVEDSSLLGCEYFTFSISNRSKFGTVGGNILEFKVDKYCDVVILTTAKDSAAAFAGYTKATDVPGITGMYPASNVVDTLYKMGIPYSDMSIDMINDLYKSSGLTFNNIYDKWLSDYFPGATKEELLSAINTASNKSSIKADIFDSVDSISSVSGSDTSFAYNVSHTKPYNAGDTVQIPDPTGKAGFDRPIVVVVKPRFTSKAPALPATFTSLDANVGNSSHFKPVHQYSCMQNPPDFTWPQISKAYSYDVVVATDEALTDVVYSKNDIKYAYYNFPHEFEPGTYWWAVRYRTTDGGEPSDWSVARRFRVDPSAHEYLVPDFGEVVASVPKTHPRIWFTEDTIDEFISQKDTPAGYTIYQNIINRTNIHMSQEFEQDTNLITSEVTSRATTLGYRAQNAALAYILTDNPKQKKIYGDYAVSALLHAATWGYELNEKDASGNMVYVNGSARNGNDQAFFELLLRTSMAFDWMYNYMVEEGREDDLKTIQDMLVGRFDTIKDYQLNLLRNEPYNSHFWSYFGYYGMTCLALVHDIEGIDDYFTQMLELNSAHLPPMSIEDGGWSKGTAYWTYAFSRDKWFMDAMKYSGYIDYYDKAWARNELNWALYMFPDNSWGSFGDESGWSQAGIGHVMGLTKLGKFTDNPVAYWLRNKIGNLGSAASNTFDAIMYADTADEVGEAPTNYPNAHFFPDQGMVGMHSSVVSSNRTSLYFRSGQYGSYNHMHADQNAFMIEHNGNKLAGKSGFYDSYHSTHDSGFTRQTFSHNTITYNGGFGQKDDSKDANGNVKQFVTHHDFDAAVGDAVNAYIGNIDKFDRSIIYLRPDSYIVVDELQNDSAQTYEWWLNSPADTMTVSGNTAHVENNGSHLNVEIVSPKVADGVFANDYINPSNGVEYYPDITSGKLNEDLAEAGFDRVHFKTPSALSTTIVATMNVNEGNEKTFSKAEGENYVKLTLDGEDTTVYVCTSAGSVVTTDSGYSFKGTALAISEGSIMLVNGTSLFYNGSSVIEETSEPITFVVGKGQMSLSADDDVVVKINKSNVGISGFLPRSFRQSASSFDMSEVTDTNLRTIEKYTGNAHGSMGIMMDYADNYFTLYADKGQYMILTEKTSFINPEQLVPSAVAVNDLGEGVGQVTWQGAMDGTSFDVEINGRIYEDVSSPFEFAYGDAATVEAKVRGVSYGLASSWSDKATMYPAHKISVSFVKFTDNGDGTVTARAKISNNSSSGALRCSLILASYNEEGNLVSSEHTRTYSLSKDTERIFTLTIDSTDAARYKAFVWNTTGNVHTIAGATSATDFVEDTGATNGLVSGSVVASEHGSVTNGYLYANLHGRTEDDYSTVNGGRITANYAANSTQYHEIYSADESLEGYDYFVFNAGSYEVSEYDPLLSFDIVEDSEVVILATNGNLAFEDYELEAKSDGWLVSRYMDSNFTKALRAIGITPTYGMAMEYDEYKTNEDIIGFEEKYISEAYSAASDKNKATFDGCWKAFTSPNANGNLSSAISKSIYTGKYSRGYVLGDGQDKLTVTIPKETSGKSSRNLIIIVRPYNGSADPNDSAVCVPLAPAASSNARPGLTAVEIDGEVIDIADFVGQEYHYSLTSDRGVLPVVKGITSDNGLYSSTDYDISADGLSATATITVKNLFTNVTPAVYTVNISLDSEASYIKDHVTDFEIIAQGAEGTFILGADAAPGYSARLTHDYLTEAGKTPFTSSPYSINYQRVFGVTDEIFGLENCYYLRMPDQNLVDTVIKSPLWSGGNGAKDVPWMQFTVNKDCDVIIVPGASVPNFVTVEENGWSENILSDYAFTLTRHGADNSYQDYTNRSQKLMYVKSYNAGDTVTLYNVNNGKTHTGYDQLPYFAFVRVK